MEENRIGKEVSDIIKIELYTDDAIKIKDLISPNEQIISKSANLKSEYFKTKYIEAFNKKVHLKSIGQDPYILTDNVCIYEPYPLEDYDEDNRIPTIVSHPIDNDVENIGYELQGDGTYKEVIVDEEYSNTKPVWIITNSELLNLNNSNQTNKKISRSASQTYQMSIGYVKSSKHYDNIFSGGDEYKFCLIGGKITSMNTAESFDNILSINLSRKDIRKKRWKKKYYELDDDWVFEEDDKELGRKFGLIEFDKNKTKRELSFEPKVIIEKVEFAVAKASISIEAKEGWIKTDNYEDRDKMITNQTKDFGHGLKDGYRIYQSGGVSWTLPIREF